jgi:hypothetical protein
MDPLMTLLEIHKLLYFMRETEPSLLTSIRDAARTCLHSGQLTELGSTTSMDEYVEHHEKLTKDSLTRDIAPSGLLTFWPTALDEFLSTYTEFLAQPDPAESHFPRCRPPPPRDGSLQFRAVALLYLERPKAVPANA